MSNFVETHSLNLNDIRLQQKWDNKGIESLAQTQIF